MNKNVIVRQIQVKDVMTKSNAPIGGYCVNPYVGCTHGCKYCYASFMKRFTGHTEEWGTFWMSKTGSRSRIWINSKASISS